MYNVKNFKTKNGEELQNNIKAWVEKTSNIDIENMSIWHDAANKVHFGTIIYIDRIHQ